MKEHLSQGKDLTGDIAIFIEQNNFDNSWNLNSETVKQLKEKYVEGDKFFRIISQGTQCSGHGWVNVSTGEILKWG